MDYKNASKLANCISSIHNKTTVREEFEHLSTVLNKIRVASIRITGLDFDISIERAKKRPSLIKLFKLNRQKNNIIRNSMPEMSSINKIAHKYNIEKIFSKHLATLSSTRRKGFVEEAKEYELAVSDNVINNSFVHHNPNIESAENDNKYLHLLIKGFEERTKEITPEKQIQNVNNKEQAEHQQKNKSITKAKITNDLDKIILESKEKEKANDRDRKSKKHDKKNEKNKDEPEL